MNAKLHQRKLVLVSFALVLVGVLLAFFAITQPKRKTYSPEELAFWVDAQGEVQVRKPNTDEFIEAKIDDSIFSTETARTGPDAKATFEIVGGAAFDLSESSRILFEKNASGKTRVTLLDGRMRWKGTGDLSFVEVARQGQIVSQDEVKDSEISANVQVIASGTVSNLVVPTQGEITDQSENELPSEPISAENRITISQEEILNVLSIRLGQFKKCYLSLIQRVQNEKIKANVLISFMILPNGNIEDSRVWKSNVSDRLFLGCLSEVVARTRFKPFRGDPIRVDEFPLDFE